MLERTNNHLKRAVIKGFKSIKELDLELEPINILIGANGSGKSNFISLFTFLRYLSEGRLQSYVEKKGFANSFFHFGVQHTQETCIDVYVGIHGYHVVFEHSSDYDTLKF